MGILFGTDGIRGVANQYPVTPELALSVGKTVASYFKTKVKNKIIIGKDTRISCDMLEHALAAGINSAGVDTYLAGVLPTPGIANLIIQMGACAGLVVSASHNPYQDNGIKVFDGNGYKLSETVEEYLEKEILNETKASNFISQDQIGRCCYIADATHSYAGFLVNSTPGLSLRGLKIVIDCSNGATYRLAPEVFKRLGADIVVLSDKPDGLNINEGCGSQHTETLVKAVIENKAHAGFAFDGDGDRVIAVSEDGIVLTGDQALAICALSLKKAGRLPGNRVVSTVMSNMGLRKAFKENDIELFIAQVGDRNVVELMKSAGSVLGGEDSGHMIFLDLQTTGDGILSALQLLYAMQTNAKPLSDLSGIMRVFPQVLINVPVSSKPEIETVPGIEEAVEEVNRRLGDGGRILIRYSGTQQLCRVMVEGPDKDETRTCAEYIASAVRVSIGDSRI